MQIRIPQPCHEDWNAMTPASGGRHCAQCAKTVTDFTGMSAEEISLYLRMNAGASLCGRFTEDQLSIALPTAEEYVLHVLRAPMTFLKQIAAIIVFALFMSAAPVAADAQTHGVVRQRPTPVLTGMVAAASDTPTQVLTGAPVIYERGAKDSVKMSKRHDDHVIMGRMMPAKPKTGPKPKK